MHTHWNSGGYAVVLTILLAGLANAVHGQNILSNVVVNSVALAPQKVRALERQYRVRILDGRYWYDAFSGAWGFEGGPTVGQILPGLALGGALRANASGGKTGVFINRRELHPLDVAALQRCTAVYRGRYWVNAQGIGGIEGGPPIFNLAALCAPRSNGRSSSRTWFNEDGSWSYHSDITGISMIGGGR